jgi:hypothetical protein
MKSKKTILAILAIAIVVVIIYRQYNKPHRSVDDEKAMRVTAADLYQSFNADESRANQLYLDKAVEVNGIVDQIITNQDKKTVVILRSGNPTAGVACTLDAFAAVIRIGDTASIKGICTGYLSDVVITNGQLINPESH